MGIEGRQMRTKTAEKQEFFTPDNSANEELKVMSAKFGNWERLT
jgi:hypothetical protein